MKSPGFDESVGASLTHSRGTLRVAVANGRESSHSKSAIMDRVLEFTQIKSTHIPMTASVLIIPLTSDCNRE